MPLSENVAYGVEAATPAQVEAAATIAQLSRDVADFPQGYATTIGERGVTLSGGQKQRTAIARAVLKNPRILLLDDALSSVDTHTEEEILRRLRGVVEGRTSLIVSHRISTVRDADAIVVLDEGRIVEQGTHEQLVVRGGLYAAMYRRQLLSEELDVELDAMSTDFFQDDEILGKAYDARLMRRLLTYLRPYRLIVAAGVALLLLGAAGRPGRTVHRQRRHRQRHVPRTASARRSLPVLRRSRHHGRLPARTAGRSHSVPARPPGQFRHPLRPGGAAELPGPARDV